MPEEPVSPTPNVKIYDRPERKGPSPLMLAIGLLILLAVSFFGYQAWRNSTPAVAPASHGAPETSPQSPARKQSGMIVPLVLPKGQLVVVANR